MILGWLGGAVLLARGLVLEVVLLTGVGDHYGDRRSRTQKNDAFPTPSARKASFSRAAYSKDSPFSAFATSEAGGWKWSP